MVSSLSKKIIPYWNPWISYQMPQEINFTFWDNCFNFIRKKAKTKFLDFVNYVLDCVNLGIYVWYVCVTARFPKRSQKLLFLETIVYNRIV